MDKPHKESTLEHAFATMLQAYQFIEPIREYRFNAKRRFRFDFAWPDCKIAVECEGGVYTQGRHTRGKGFESDCEKYNLATLQGWRVLRFTRRIIESREAIENLLVLFNS